VVGDLREAFALESGGEEDIDNGIGMELVEEGNRQSWQVRGLPAKWYLWKIFLQTLQGVGTLLPLNLCPHWKHCEVLDVVVAVAVATDNVVGEGEDDPGDICAKFDKLFTEETI
jgi:hypothetical protein